jgi:hypothetical protein
VYLLNSSQKHELTKNEVLADFLHKRQLIQEAQAKLDQPLSENVVLDSKNESKEM